MLLSVGRSDETLDKPIKQDLGYMLYDLDFDSDPTIRLVVQSVHGNGVVITSPASGGEDDFAGAKELL